MPATALTVLTAPAAELATLAAEPCDKTDFWCNKVEGWTGSDWLAAASSWLVAKPAHVIVLLLIGWLVRRLLFGVIDRLVKRAAQGNTRGLLARGKARQFFMESSAVAQERRRQRTDTMGSLLKSIVSVVVFTVILVMILDVLGFNVAPVLASAGILGVALGFGSQSLVRDFLSGIFMILEDQYGVGDVVDAGEAVGTVEAVGLRITRLRDVNGTVWYVRNGEIMRIGNMSQNWSRAVLDVNVSYDDDLDRVRDVLLDEANRLRLDPVYASKVLEDPEVWGVEALDPGSVTMRLVLKTAPQEQWSVARALRERIKDRFQAEGIKIPYPQRVVWNVEESPYPQPGGRAAEPGERPADPVD